MYLSYVRVQQASPPAVVQGALAVAMDGDLDDRVFSAGDLSAKMVGRTMSNLSAMSSDSTADSALDSVDVSLASSHISSIFPSLLWCKPSRISWRLCFVCFRTL
jgi:hypothetical protein